jgi:flagellar L-ring protein precursor FlgH
MKTGASKILIALTVASLLNMPVYAESLFRIGVSQNAYPIQPKSLFSSVKAKFIGDLVTIIVNEEVNSSDDLNLEVEKTSDTTENFRDLVNKLLPGKLVPEGIDDFGGSNAVENAAKVSRKTVFQDTITAQVVQILPNGNLVVQGKKTAINAGERVNILLSGIIDPRLISSTGTINSSQVANLQLAMVGEGTISRSDNEGTVNKFIRYLF